MIAFTDITVVVQGAVGEMTAAALASIRQHLPGAQLILSTWQDTDITGLNADRFVFNADPGGYPVNNVPGAATNNLNRQIVSTHAGLMQVTTPYALKLRTDFLLTGHQFLDYFQRYPQRGPGPHLFSERVLACCYFTRNPHGTPSFPFHLSDIAFFGHTGDVRQLFAIPLLSEPEHRWDETAGHPGTSWNQRYAAEQHIFLNALRLKSLPAPCEHSRDATPENRELTDRYLANEVILLEFEPFNLLPTKSVFRREVHPTTFACCYTHYDWQRLYRHYADPAFPLPERDEERQRIRQAYHRYKKYRLLANMLTMWIRSRPRKKRLRHAVLEYFLNATTKTSHN